MAQSEPVDLAQKLELARQTAEWMRREGVRRLDVTGEFCLELGPQPVLVGPIPDLTSQDDEPDPIEELNSAWDRRELGQPEEPADD